MGRFIDNLPSQSLNWCKTHKTKHLHHSGARSSYITKTSQKHNHILVRWSLTHSDQIRFWKWKQTRPICCQQKNNNIPYSSYLTQIYSISNTIPETTLSVLCHVMSKSLTRSPITRVTHTRTATVTVSCRLKSQNIPSKHLVATITNPRRKSTKSHYTKNTQNPIWYISPRARSTYIT